MRTAIIILICWLIEWPLACGQDLGSTLHKADSLWRMRDTTCIPLYERALFFAHAEQKREIRLGLTKALYQLNDWRGLRKLLWNADLELDSLGRETMMYYLRLRMKDGDFRQVMELGRTYAQLVPGEGRRFLFYGMMAALEDDDLQGMRIFAVELLDSSGLQKLDGLFRRYGRRLKKPGKARWMSIVPGMGQMYARDPGDAAKSLLLNAGIGYLIYDMWDRSQGVAIYLALGLVPRYYFGGIRNAGKSAGYRNVQLKNELRIGVLTLIQEMLTVEN